LDGIWRELRNPELALRPTLGADLDQVERAARAAPFPLFIVRALRCRGMLLQRLGRHDDAGVALHEGRSVARAFDLKDPELWCLLELARLAAAQHDWRATVDICAEGIALTESMRRRINVPYLRSAFLRERVDFYRLGVRAALGEPGLNDPQLQRALAWADLSKSRVARPADTPVRDAGLHAALDEIEAQFRRLSEEIRSGRASAEATTRRRALWDRLVASRFPGEQGELDPFPLDRLQSELTADTGVIYYYWIDRDALLIVAIDRSQVLSVVQHVNAEMRGKLDRYTEVVRTITRMTPALNAVQEFSTLLLPSEVAPVLSDNRRLVLSPHRRLHLLPFHALHWRGRPLIDAFAISYAPSLRNAMTMLETPDTNGILALGTNRFDVSGEFLQPLPNAEEEVRRVTAAHASVSVALYGERATSTEVARLAAAGDLEKFRYIHLALHGGNLPEHYPMESCLFLRDARLDAMEIALWRLSAQLVVLTACHAGKRAVGGRDMEELPGDDLQGLQAAFFLAGARAVLGALWPVESEEALHMSQELHRWLARGEAPDTALQRALWSVRDRTPSSRRYAYYWAPFFLSIAGR
jgi:CHAT domain-containing protein